MKRDKRVITSILFLAFSTRLIGALIAVSRVPLQTWEYEIIAGNILNGLGYSFGHFNAVHYAFGPPLYTLFTAFIYLLTNHSQTAIIIIQTFFSFVTCLFIFEIARRIFDHKIGLLACFLAALHPGLILYSSKLHPLTFDALLITVTFFLLLKAKDGLNARDFLSLGIVFGFTMLTRGTILFFLILSFIYLSLKASPKKRMIAYFILTFTTALLIIGPWLIRNYLVLHKFVFIQKSGEVFWRGNNPNASGTSYTLDGRIMIDSASKKFLHELYNSDEIKQDRLFWREGIDFIKKHPYAFLALTVKKFYYFWYFSPNSGTEYPKFYLYIYKALYIPAFLFAIIGIFHVLNSGRERTKENSLLLLLLLFTISLTQSFFYVEGRHRWAVEPLLLIFTAQGLIYTGNKVLLNRNIT